MTAKALRNLTRLSATSWTADLNGHTVRISGRSYHDKRGTRISEWTATWGYDGLEDATTFRELVAKLRAVARAGVASPKVEAATNEAAVEELRKRYGLPPVTCTAFLFTDKTVVS